MNCTQFKDPVSHTCHMCPSGNVITSWSLTQEVAGSNPFTVMTNNFVIEFTKFIENVWGKLK